jgi:hypothetical protein
MANYLQRIAISGSRTTSVAKPSAISPTLLPPLGSSVYQPRIVESMPRGAEIDSEIELPPVKARREEPIRAQVDEPAPHDGSVVEPAIPSRPTHIVQPEIFDAKVLAPKELRRGYVDNGGHHEIGQELAAAMSNVAIPDIQNKVGKNEASVTSHFAPAQALPVPTTQGIEVKPSGPKKLNPTDTPPPPRVVTEGEMVTETYLFEVQPQKSQRTTLPQISNASGKSHNRISIGKIDVQVHNLPSPEPVNSVPTRQPIRSSFLEGHYLNRFFLKP